MVAKQIGAKFSAGCRAPFLANRLSMFALRLNPIEKLKVAQESTIAA